ncbi:MAG: carboxyl transferase domain-containing protein [Longimicrobiales bacterium]
MSRLRVLAEELRELRSVLVLGGGEERIRRQHDQGKWTARERITHLLDEGSPWVELGLLVAYDQYEGQAPAAGVVTGIGVAEGREIVVVANDATVKAGSWWPETIKKMLRAQEVAMRCRIPIVYLVDSAGVNLPYQGGVFPGQYGAARIFYYNSIMRRFLAIPQLAAVMGPCIAGGAYLPALSDVILMVEGTSFMGLGGPNLVKGATGQTVETEELGGARVHTEVSGVAHYRVADDEACVAKLRALIAELPHASAAKPRAGSGTHAPHDVDDMDDGNDGNDGDRLGSVEDTNRARNPADLYDLLPEDHRLPYDMGEVLAAILDDGGWDEFQPGHADEMICGTGSMGGIRVGVIANARTVIDDDRPGPPRLGGIIYTESAEKVAFFIDTMNRHGTPLLFVQDVAGFMVGPEAEHSGIIRAGARFVEAMATATVPKLVLTLNHASGAGYYAMAGQGFDPDFILSLPTGRMGVMEGESAIMALFGRQLEELKAAGSVPDEDLSTRLDEVRADYDRQLDARFAAARGFVDEIVLPEEIRPALILLLKAALNNPGPHLGPFGLGAANPAAYQAPYAGSSPDSGPSTEHTGTSPAQGNG